jgi:hypothetical protein
MVNIIYYKILAKKQKTMNSPWLGLFYFSTLFVVYEIGQKISLTISNK